MSTKTERWRPVVGWEGLYEVSDLGGVRSLPRQTANGLRGGRLLRPSKCADGYLRTSLYQNGTRESRYVHAIVAEAFIGLRPNGHYCCHNNGNPCENTLANLRWDKPAGNEADKIKHGTTNRGAVNGAAKLNEAQVLAIRADQRFQFKIAADYGISQKQVSNIKRRVKWTHVP